MFMSLKHHVFYGRFWKRNCNLCKQCCYTNQAEILFQKNICHPLCTTVKYDLTTSVSSLRIPSGDEKGIPDHAYRKVGYGRRRQYVDCPTSAKSVSKLDSAECQTDRRTTFHTESQTQRSMKEMPVQTVSKCDLCNRQLQIFSTTADMQAITQSAPCTPCPALVQLIRGVPCCPGCRCVAGIVQVPQQSEQQQTQRQDQEKKTTKDQMQWMQPDQKSYGMLTNGQHEDPKITGMAGTITKLTLASYSVAPSKKTNTSSQTATDEVNTTTPDSTGGKKVRLSTLQKEKPRGKRPTKNPNEMLIPEKEKTETTNDVEKGSNKLPSKKPTNPSTKKAADSRNIVESVSDHENPEIPSPLQQMAQVINRLEAIESSKTYNKLQETSDISTPTVDETDKNGVDERSEALPKINAKNARMESDVGDATASEITFENIKSDKDDNSKFDESMRKHDSTRVERGTLPAAKPDTRTQTTDIDVSLIKPKRTRLLRKKNKVDPAELTHAEMDVQTSYSDDLDVLSIDKQESERLFVGEKQVLGVEKDINICRACRRLQTYPTSNSFRYYSVYRDKRGRVYCELCATTNTIKVLYKDDGSEQKRLRCVVCKNVVRAKSSQEETTSFRSKSDNCPKCDQVQTRTHSTLVNPSKV
ncbi:uncharacterized protein LOC143342011 [Colletes latitarsis]|uniref:uncharacterized protein LOC143342011 n=1 Tax=Colletes latitarsis TaxID=2605962 RepID=UPI004035F8BC